MLERLGLCLSRAKAMHLTFEPAKRWLGQRMVRVPSNALRRAFEMSEANPTAFLSAIHLRTGDCAASKRLDNEGRKKLKSI